MKNFTVEYTYKVELEGTHVVKAETQEEAEQLTREWVYDQHIDCLGVTIDSVKEIKDAA